MGFSPDFACPVIMRIHAKHDLNSQEHMDARAHDVHCAGYLLFYLLTSLPYFTPLDVSDDDAAATWAAVAEKHLSWVSCTICPQHLLLLGSLHVRSFEWHVRATSVWHCSVTASCFCKAPTPSLTWLVCPSSAKKQMGKHWAETNSGALLQAEACKAEGAKADSHPMLAALKAVSADCAEYESMCSVIRHMLHPDVRQRATVEQALEAGFLADA